jgi:hypothetical protein
MSPEQNFDLLVRFTRVLAWVLLGLALACGLGYLAVSTYFYFQGAKTPVWYFAFLGSLFSLTTLFAMTMLVAKDKPFVYFTFFFTGVFAIAFIIVLLFTLPSRMIALNHTLLIAFLSINILAILASFVVPINRVFGQYGPSWTFLVAYFFEMGFWIVCIALYGGVYGNDWTFLLLCGMTLLRSSQYEYLGPCEPLSRKK